MTDCTCPDQWFELVGVFFCANEDCPAYKSCGGWTWDPPCGGCDSCLLAQVVYADDGTMAQAFAAYDLWVRGQVANA
ncbi:hypothetical protein [Streptomyces sp. OK228]|uniref:hypothetical protein n=1 Tax=Streptomyces sp. OK228 TaxID=1882786 RepID=UPI000BE23B0D|nr:hypothetical protein [Streptomyces sp. OK228]